jgi:hypothetical protein
LLIAGATGSGRCSLVNVLLGQPDLLPVSPIPKIPLGITLTGGESFSAQLSAPDGSREMVPAGRLRAALTTPASNGGHYDHVKLTVSSELLTLTELRIEPLEAERSPLAWKELLAGIDYVILVLNANRLLSEPEKRFVREALESDAGLQRMAIVINQMDLVPEDERTSIVELVQTFLGPFESRPPLLSFSAAQARKALTSGISTGDDSAMLHSLVHDHLLEHHRALRTAALRQAIESCLMELSETAQRREALLALTDSEIEALEQRITSRQEWLRGRIQRSQRRIEAFINTLIKEQFLREIEGFGELVRRRLPDEIMEVEDTTAIKRHLPGYLETIWSGLLDHQATVIRARLMDETAAIARLAETDLEELLADGAAAVRGSYQGFATPSSFNLNAFVAAKRGSHRASSAAKGLALSGFVMIIWNIPLGLAQLGASQLIRTVFKGDIAIADKKAITAAAQTSVHELERQIKRQIETRFAELTTELSTEVEKIYTQGIEQVREFLDERLKHYGELAGRRIELDRLQQETIPALRHAIESLQ